MSESEAPLKTARSALVGAGMGAVAAGILALLSFVPPIGELLQKWDYSLYDYRLKVSRHPEDVSKEIVVLEIDDRTVRGMELNGVSWPPDRWFYGDLVETLSALRPRAIVFDYVFSDQRDGVKYDINGDPFAEVGAGSKAEYTRIAAKQMHAAGNVVIGIYAMNMSAEESADAVHETIGWNEKLVPYFERRVGSARGSGFVPQYPVEGKFTAVLRYPEGSMLVGARSLGLVNQQHVNEIDGVARKFQPLVEIDGRVTPDLAATALLVDTSAKASFPMWAYTAPPPAEQWPLLPEIIHTAGEVRIGKHRIPVDSRGSAWIRWRGDWERDPHLMARTKNALEIWENRDNVLLGEPLTIDPKDYEGKIVVIGFTGQGEGSDYVTTPFGSQPGVYRHAAILDTILTGDYPTGMPTGVDWAAAFVLASLTGSLVLGRARASTRISGNTVLQVTRLSLIGLFPVVGFFALGMLAFRVSEWTDMPALILKIVPAELATLLTIPPVVFLGIAWAQAEERRARKIAVRALGPALVKQVLAGGGELKMGGTKVPLTLYFSDIAGFTTISEKLSPEDLIAMLNEYLTRVSEILHDGHGATIDKYIGDAVMAFWGAPLPEPDGPVKACMAALDVMAAIDEFSAELVAQGLSPLRTRIGLNTGIAVAGGVGHVRDLDDGKFSYTAMGDTVNLASRLEGANKAYGTTCMIGPETFDQAKHAILARELDLVRVKGKTIPVRVYELMGKASDPAPEKRAIKERYEAALARFRKREFAEARQEFLALSNETGDPPSKTLAACCDERLRTPPPPEWDGSNELHEK